MWTEAFDDRLVAYTQEIDGRFVVVEQVPARVNRETGEQTFTADTVTRLQAIIRSSAKPVRVLETPVYEFTATPA